MSKKWVYLFSEVEEAEEYAGDWEGVRSLLGGCLLYTSDAADDN